MSFWAKVRSIILPDRRSAANAGAHTGEADDALREFVYLDEVSLRSLLSSKKDGVTDTTSEQKTSGREAEIEGTASADAGFIAKAEVASRYQTSNSSTVQTSRKATVQSWFREFLAIPKVRFIQPIKVDSAAADVETLKGEVNPSRTAKSSDLKRGALVEYRVKLSADPVFHLGTMVSEFTGMAEDYPEMFAGGNALVSLREAQPINRILQRLLAGLIPIRAEALDYSVIEIDDVEYVVHNGLLEGLNLDSKPLEIVGVTEHLAYWKDIRRVLFSNAEFTMLCRISRSGLQQSWTPVKLADLFRDVAPTLVDQINAAGRVPFGSPQLTSSESSIESKMRDALGRYKVAVLAEDGKTLSVEQEVSVSAEIVKLQALSGTAYGQRSAFAGLKQKLSESADLEVEAAKDLELRDQARQSSGLPMFPALATGLSPSPVPLDVEGPGERLLDVDVIAIYW